MKVTSTIWPRCRAVKRGYKDGRPAKFRAFPPGSNEIIDEQAFDTEQVLADYLLSNPSWKTYFRSHVGKTAQHLAIVVR